MLTLYYSPGTCSLVTHVALHEAGAEHEAKRVDFAKNEQRSPEYLAVNPHGRVPALVTDEGTITENLAILGFIADTYGAPGSIPRGDRHAVKQQPVERRGGIRIDFLGHLPSCSSRRLGEVESWFNFARVGLSAVSPARPAAAWRCSCRPRP